MLNEAYLGLGSNLGDSVQILRTALEAMQTFAIHIRVSSLYKTSPQGFRSQPVFYNAACHFWTTLSPYQLMERLLELESAIGRQRTFRNAPRLIDLDVLLYNRLVLNTPPLVLPHPHMTARLFVLKPLTDLSPHLIHPVISETVSDMLKRLPSSSESIVRIPWQ